MSASHLLPHPALARRPSRRRHRRARLFDRATAAWALLRRWRSRVAERTQLSRFDERSLRDIGISPSEAAREWRKPFWKA